MKNINVDVRQLKAFMAVARHESFTRAAEELYMTQPGLSLTIQHLEDQLGVSLFDRSTRRVEITEAGQEFVVAASRILSDIESTFNDIKDLATHKRGRVSIAILPSLASRFVPRLIARFKMLYPDIKVMIRDAIASPLIKMVENGEVDFGLGLRLQFERDLVFNQLMSDKLVALIPRGNLLEESTELSWADLMDKDIIAMSRDTSVRHLMEYAFAKIGYSFNPTYEATYMSTAISMVESGLGISVLPSLALPALRIPDVHVRELNSPIITRDVGIIFKKNKEFTPAVEVFLKVLKNDIKIKNLIREISI